MKTSISVFLLAVLSMSMSILWDNVLNALVDSYLLEMLSSITSQIMIEGLARKSSVNLLIAKRLNL